MTTELTELFSVMSPRVTWEQPARIKVEVPNISAAVYACLVGVPQDPNLRTQVKKGAFYSAQVDSSSVLAFPPGAPLTKVVDHQTVFEIGSQVRLQYKPSSMMLTVHGWCEIVGSVGFGGY